MSMKEKSDTKKEYMKKWFKAHKGYYKNWWRKQKRIIHQLLGGECVVCGYIGTALQIDHVFGGGRKEINSVGMGNYYSFVIKKIKNGTKDYQLLCANCNWEKRYKNKEHGGRNKNE